MANGLDSGDAEDVAWLVIESLLSGSDSASALLGATKLLRELYGTATDGGENLVANPFFLDNGHEGRSPKTVKYFTGRSWKSLGSSGVSFASGLASGVTVVDVGGIAQHASAIGTSAVHLHGVRAAGSKFKRSETITRWVDSIIAAKSAKIAVRGVGLAGSSIPIPGVGLATGIGTTLAKLGIKLTLGKLVARTAMEVHWRAYQEVKLGSAFGGASDGPCGPASAVVYEIFTKRSFTRLFGKYDTAALINEPAGWMALNDKLMLI